MTLPQVFTLDNPEIYLTAMPGGFQWINFNTGFFAIYGEKAEQFRLNIYDSELILLSSFELQSFAIHREIAWISLSNLPSNFAYSWQIQRVGLWGSEFSDPFHPWLAGEHYWRGVPPVSNEKLSTAHFSTPRYDLSWVQGDIQSVRSISRKPSLPRAAMKIYECHVRSATLNHPLVEPSLRGTLEALPILLDQIESLGFNAIELLPLHEFNELLPTPEGREQRVNFWGYMPLHLMAIMRAYSAKGTSIAAERALIDFVDQAHKRGIEVLLDVVFNHIDGVENQNLRQTVPHLGFHHTADFKPVDYSGCGNTLQVQHPPLAAQLLQILRSFATRLGIDGFRFDLAGAFSRLENGSCDPRSSFLLQLSQDPWLKDLKLIAEPWDAAGSWLVGQMAPLGFYEWNDRYRDYLRHFLHFSHSKALAATRLCGSQDIYGSLGSPHAIHYITCHDGFSLRDLVSYNDRHNEANGEEGRDGHQHNLSCNHGIEGATDDIAIIELRERQIRNFLLALAITKGPIMIYGGDEYGHTRLGNNNPWCQDNSLNALDWQAIAAHGPLMEYWQRLIQWRTQFQLPEIDRFYTPQECIWYDAKGASADWSLEDGLLFFELRKENSSALIAFNSSCEPVSIKLPKTRSQAAKTHPSPAYWTPIVSNFLLPSSIPESSNLTLPAKSSLLLQWQ